MRPCVVAIGLTVAALATGNAHAGGERGELLATDDSRDSTPARTAQTYPTPPLVLVEPRLISPFPVVRIVGRLTRIGARIRILSVRAPVGARILVRCRRGECRRRTLKRGRGIRRAVRVRAFERQLLAGTIVEVFVRRGEAIGKYTRFRIRRGRRPARRDLCLRPGERKGGPCPEL